MYTWQEITTYTFSLKTKQCTSVHSQVITIRSKSLFFETAIFHHRYSDIMVHRLLAVAIGALDSYPDLLNKDKTQVGVSGLSSPTYMMGEH